MKDRALGPKALSSTARACERKERSVGDSAALQDNIGIFWGLSQLQVSTLYSFCVVLTCSALSLSFVGLLDRAPFLIFLLVFLHR